MVFLIENKTIYKKLIKMNLECLNGIITDNLAIQIDLTQLKSWDLNTGFTAFSLTKWAGAISDNINLIDFGLTEFDNGRTNIMWSGITLTPKDTLFSMYRIGYNVIQNPTSNNTSGYTATTKYNGYSISGITTSTFGNYFELNGGYLQGFFKLDGYNFSLLPSRYNNGITIETLVKLEPDSQGIFYMMGLRAEDKYNPYFSGETTISGTSIIENTISGTTISGTGVSGVNSSENNYLDAFYKTDVNRLAFADWSMRKKVEYKEFPPIDNIKGNAIAFFLTAEKHLGYKYIDNEGLIVQNISPTQIFPTTGWTMIAISFLPNDIITYTDYELFLCAPQRMGKMIFYVNGRAQWILRDFPEYFFHALKNQKEKQIGVPYSISWGGGSFGLRHSWHYDYQKYKIYTGEDTQYIEDNFFVEADPIPTECYIPPTGSTYLPGLALSADSNTFSRIDKCDPTIIHPTTVMRIEYTGTTGNTGGTANKYFIKFNHPITVLSNRDYEIDMSFFDSGFFKTYDINGNEIINKATIIVYGTVDIDIVDEVRYSNPLTATDLLDLYGGKLHPFPDRQDYQYIYTDGVMYYGATGLPVAVQDAIFFGFAPPENYLMYDNTIYGNVVTGTNGWKPLKAVFRTKENSGQQIVYIGLLLESKQEFNLNMPIYVNDFTYTGADILVQDPRKNDLLIEQNFDESFIGGIQKLRVYNRGLTPSEILHNALIEMKLNPSLNMRVTKGGRIIYR
jgi:hypothetical protein